MRTLISVLLIAVIIIFTCFSATAAEFDDLLKDNNADEIINSLPDDAKNSLNDLGIKGFDYSALEKITPEKILSGILNTFTEQGKTPLKAFAAVVSILLLYSILYGLRNSFESSLQPVLSVVTTICICCALVIPLTDFITSAVGVIKTSSDFMLSYIPLMTAVISFSGQPLSAAGYYGIMTFSGQAVNRISSEIIAPFMKVFLAVSVSSAVSPNINLGGIVRFISKLTKILLGFVMSVFTGVLSFKQVVSAGADSLSSRAVRFSLTSFVPVVGSALSEAYRTIQGSVGVLKSGAGVIAVIAVAVMYLPIIIQCVFWILTLLLSKSIGEMLCLREPCALLEAVYTVVSTLLAVILCLAAVFLISTAVVILTGGGG